MHSYPYPYSPSLNDWLIVLSLYVLAGLWWAAGWGMWWRCVKLWVRMEKLARAQAIEQKRKS